MFIPIDSDSNDDVVDLDSVLEGKQKNDELGTTPPLLGTGITEGRKGGWYEVDSDGKRFVYAVIEAVYEAEELAQKLNELGEKGFLFVAVIRELIVLRAKH